MCVKHICTYIHMTRPYVGHDSFMCVTRRHWRSFNLWRLCPRGTSVWHDLFVRGMFDMNHSCVSHTVIDAHSGSGVFAFEVFAFMWMPGLVGMCDMIYSCVTCLHRCCFGLWHLHTGVHMCSMTRGWMCAMTHSCKQINSLVCIYIWFATWRVRVCDMIHSCVTWHALINAAAVFGVFELEVHMCDIVWHYSCMCMTLNRTRECHDAFVCTTWMCVYIRI